MIVFGHIHDYQLASSVVFVISSFGMVVNWFIFLFIHRLPSMANPFGYITTNQAIGNALHLTLFCFYFSPMVFFDIGVMKRYSHYCGIILIMCLQLSLYSHALVSFNRFCAIYLPFRYRKIFTLYTTIALVILIWMLSTFPILYVYGYAGCRFQYSADYWRFGLAFNERCPVIPFPTNVPTFSTFLLIIIFLDFITLYRIRLYNKQIAEQQRFACWSQPRQEHEIRFLKQACTQAIFFATAIVVYFLPFDSSSRWVNFGFTTVNWITVHATDGLITIAYNRAFREVLCLHNQLTATTKT